MNLNQIDLQGFILALFIRDDNERFLLGSGIYEFVKKQLHFKANSIQSDIVEVQGDDGLFLVAQVRRANKQDFDGYVGDNTVSRSDIEKYRRAFLGFFRKNHYYTVVYIFHDGSAIQRKRGFIVDAPEVKELYQFFPEYHVSLNFEDVNYYTYSEDGDGNEIYSKNAIIPLSISPADGGLMWDEYGAVSQELNWSGTATASGIDINIDNPLNYRVPLSDLRIGGNSIQTDVPSYIHKAPIKNVTGLVSVTNTDSNGNVETYPLTLGSIELCNIGSVSDYIHKSGGSWLLEKDNYKFTVAGNLTLKASTSAYIVGLLSTNNSVASNLSANALASIALCDRLLIGGNSTNKILGTDSQGRIEIQLSKSVAPNINAMNSVLSGMNIYVRIKSHITTILSGAFATELDNLLGAQLFKGSNSITSTVGDSATKPMLGIKYYTESVDGEGFIWEEGTGGGSSVVSVDSIENVYPIWEVEGPAINPKLINITTNTTLSYTGAISAGQKLVIDMFNKTAYINGTSVVLNVSGDWVYFEKGNNKISYITDNNDALASTIYWQEVVG